MLRRVVVKGWLLFAMLSQASMLQALTVISNLPGNDDAQSGGLGGLRQKGMQFRVVGSAPYIINLVRLRLRTDPADSPIITLNADASGNPGAVIGTFTNPSSFGNGKAEYKFTGDFIVHPSTRYWIVANGPQGLLFDWLANRPPVPPTGIWVHTDAKASYDGGASWEDSDILNSYAIEATLVPEPATVIALAVSLGALAANRRRGEKHPEPT